MLDLTHRHRIARRLENQDILYNRPSTFLRWFDVINSDRAPVWVWATVFPVSVVIDTI